MLNIHGYVTKMTRSAHDMGVVICNGVWMPKVQESITILRLTGTRNRKISSQLSFAPNDKLSRAGMNDCGFNHDTGDMAESWQCCECFMYFN